MDAQNRKDEGSWNRLDIEGVKKRGKERGEGNRNRESECRKVMKGREKGEARPEREGGGLR